MGSRAQICVLPDAIRANVAAGKDAEPTGLVIYPDRPRIDQRHACHAVEILGDDGEPVAVLRFSAQPLGCGAHVWIECDEQRVRLQR